VTLEDVLTSTESRLRAVRQKFEGGESTMATKAAATSLSLQIVRDSITREFIEKWVMPLMNSPLGFMTDRGPSSGKRYAAEELIDPVCECLVRGFSLVGNEFNVIAGRFYGAQAGYRRLVREIPGVTDMEELAGEPVFAQGGGTATVRYIVRLKVDGKPWQLKGEKAGETTGRKFTIRVNSGMGPDAVIGKAARKALKAVYEQLTGTTITDFDEPEAITPEVNGNGETLQPGRQKIPSKQPSIQPSPETKPDAKPINEPREPTADELAALDAANDLAERLGNAIEESTTLAGLQKLGGELNAAKGTLGEDLYGRLMKAWQAEYKALGGK
jgi:hypothetical protein